MIKEFVQVDQENVEIILKREIKLEDWGFTVFTYAVGIGQLLNGAYIVVSLNPNIHFCIKRPTLFEALDKTYDILDAYTGKIINKCSFCGRLDKRCMNTRDCEDSSDKICKAALLVAGGGEYTWIRIAASRLFQENRMPEHDKFKQQIKNGDMSFVDLANMYLER